MSDNLLRAVVAIHDGTPNYGSKNCTCGTHATPDRECTVHWANYILEQNGLDYHQTHELVASRILREQELRDD